MGGDLKPSYNSVFLSEVELADNMHEVYCSLLILMNINSFNLDLFAVVISHNIMSFICMW